LRERLCDFHCQQARSLQRRNRSGLPEGPAPFLAALAEAAPFIPGGPVEAFGLFAVMWLSSSGLVSARTISFGRSASSNSEQAQLSVRRSGSKKGKRSRTVELD